MIVRLQCGGYVDTHTLLQRSPLTAEAAPSPGAAGVLVYVCAVTALAADVGFAAIAGCGANIGVLRAAAYCIIASGNVLCSAAISSPCVPCKRWYCFCKSGTALPYGVQCATAMVATGKRGARFGYVFAHL